MHTLRKPIIFIFAILLTFNFSGFSQDPPFEDSTKTKLITIAKDIMTAAGTCALITLDHEGRPRVRTMDPFDPESDLTVWLGTNSMSRKVTQIKNDPRVTLYYLDSDATGYVMIHGTAELVNDEGEKDKRWKIEWETFYPDKTKNYLLIKVSPLWMEVSSAPRGIVGDTTTWQPPTVIINSKY